MIGFGAFFAEINYPHSLGKLRVTELIALRSLECILAG